MDSKAPLGIRALLGKMEELASQRDEVKVSLKKAEEEISDLAYQLAKAREELHRKNLEVEFLTLSHKLAESPQSLANARSTIRGILAKVEKAIALLKDDARI